MNSEDRDEHRQDSEPSGEDREAARSPENEPDVVTTTDPAITSGRGEDQGRNLRPDETIVAETSRVTRAVPSYVPEASAFVEPERPGKGQKGKPEGQGRDGGKAQHEDEDRSDDRRGPAHSGQPGWMSYVIMGAVALACGVGGAWAFSHFDQSKKDDQAQKGGNSQQSKKGGDSSSKKGDSSEGHAKGQTSGGGSSSDSGSEIPGFTSAEDADTLKKQIEHLSSRFDTLQQRVESMVIPRETPPPDVGTLQIKMGELSRTVGDLTGLTSQSRQMANRLDHLQEEIRGLRDQLSAAKERGGVVTDTPTIGSVDHKVVSLAGPPPAPPTSILPSDPDSPDEAMAEGIALFKKGRYPQADDIFRKLQLTRPQDARVWYYSALAHGFATGEWEGDTRRFVMQGADRERAGLPSTSQIDTAFAGLSAAQGRDWLASYRAQLVKR